MSESEELEFDDNHASEEENYNDAPVAKKRRAFFEDSAEEGSEESSFTDEDESENPEEKAAFARYDANIETRRNRSLGALQRLEEQARRSAEKEEDEDSQYYDEDSEGEYTDGRHHTSTDPAFWTVEVTPGREHAVVMSLLFKAAHEAGLNRNISICSAFNPPQISGYVIIEAYALAAVKAAISNIQGIRRDPRTRRPTLMKVPREEMKNLASVSDEIDEVEYKAGSFVRITTGVYRGDLALVTKDSDSTDEIEVLVVPRLKVIIDDNKLILSSKAQGNNFRARLPAELLTRNKVATYIRSSSSYSTRSTGTYAIGNYTFTDGGLLYYSVKKEKVSGSVNDIPPTADELAPFVKNLTSLSQHSTDDSLIMVQNATKSIEDAISSVRAAFSVGSPVIAKRGGNTSQIIGKCIHKTDELTKIQVTSSKSGRARIETVSTSQVLPYFRVGDTILVTAGDYEDISGVVTHVDPDYTTLTIVPSAAGFGGIQPFNVTPNLCVFYSGTATGKDCVNGIYVYDLVSYHADGSSVGMVLRHLKDKAQLLTKQNTITIASQENLQVLPSKRRVVFDAENRPLAVNDTVRIVKSTFAGREAIIKKIWEDVLFLYAENIENNFIALPANSVLNRSSAPSTNTAGDSFMPSPSVPSTIGATPGMGNAALRRTHRTGQRVKLGMVQYKGLLGTIIKANDANVVVRLDIGKIVTISTKQIQQYANTLTLIQEEASTFNDTEAPQSFRKKRTGQRHGTGSLNQTDNSNQWSADGGSNQWNSGDTGASAWGQSSFTASNDWSGADATGGANEWGDTTATGPSEWGATTDTNTSNEWGTTTDDAPNEWGAAPEATTNEWGAPNETTEGNEWGAPVEAAPEPSGWGSAENANDGWGGADSGW